MGMRVLFYCANLSGSGHYRCVYPARALRRRGHRADWRVGVSLNPETYDPVDTSYDVYVIQMAQHKGVLTLLRRLAALGKVGLVEVDDHVRATPFYNPAFRAFRGRDGKARALEECARAADGVTVSTPELAELFTPLNPNTFPLPNCIDLGDPAWNPRPEKEAGRVVVGWAGSPTHLEDFRPLVPVLEALCRRYPQVKVAVGGPKEVFALLDQVPEEQKEYLPPVPFEEYPGMLARFDVGLVPLADNSFNRCKSDLKGLEYSALGIPFVASPLPAYRRLVEEGENGFLCSHRREWFGRLSVLVEKEDLRRRMGRRAREIVERRMSDHYAPLWEGILETLILRRRLLSAVEAISSPN
ncbi:MAG: glycosyltransferase [Actinomycetota bacterium]|nr:glycosyltransferase [Actinomycetota bacterium]